MKNFLNSKFTTRVKIFDITILDSERSEEKAIGFTMILFLL